MRKRLKGGKRNAVRDERGKKNAVREERGKINAWEGAGYRER